LVARCAARKSPAGGEAKVLSEGACRACDNGKPIETIPQSVAQRRGDSQRSIKSRRTLQRGNTIPKTNRDRHRAVIPLAKGSRFGPVTEKAPQGAGLSWSCCAIDRACRRRSRASPPTQRRAASSVAQRPAIEKAPPKRGLSQPCGSPEENARKGNPHRDTTTEMVAQQRAHRSSTHSNRPQKKPRRSGAKVLSEGGLPLVTTTTPRVE
jgi:hypothetical protein